mgnify:CR=1 FL=1|jgi:GNAT superfamily N-acetyltransferase
MERADTIEADFDNSWHSQTVLYLINAYAKYPMGDGRPLFKTVQEKLIPGLKANPTTTLFFAICQKKLAGIITCFKGFSAFIAKPLINISDYFVLPRYRGNWIGSMLLHMVGKKAILLNCFKLILELQENNLSARKIYEKAGFP